MRADLEEDLVRDIIVRVRAASRRGCSRAGATVGECRPARGQRARSPSEISPAHAAAGALDERRNQFARVFEAERGIVAEADAAVPSGGPFARKRAIAIGVIGVCGSAERTVAPTRSA